MSGRAGAATALLAAEWIKIRTLRSTLWSLLPFLVGGVGLAALLGASFRASLAAGTLGGARAFDPLFAAFYGLTVAQLGVVVFAALVVGGEYGTGTIRASLTAVPRRGRFYAAKVAAGMLVAAAVALVTVPAAFLVSQSLLGPYGTAITADGVVEALTGTVVYVTLMCGFTLGVATMLRSTTRSLGILLPVFLLGSQGLANVPGIGKVIQYLPDQSGWVIMHLAGPAGDPRFGRDYGPWTGIGILVLWTAVSLIGGYLVLRRRDA
ncbi:ABC transporter permease subunit [Thermopolyspora sp. NPDC052614]|uniref:ABC transporter permease subunit n=1 Tax=Thermopolyspora sp. NPDC052614 TaxID=3155682 RepID=UPI0034340E0A